jgi:protein-disulfide isomerase
MQKGTAVVGFFLSFFMGMLLMYGIQKSSDTRLSGENVAAKADSEESDKGDSPIQVGKDDPTWGNPDALVTILEASDFECPFCTRVNPTMKQIKDTYGPEKVRIVWKHNPLPFHKKAMPAHEASVAAMELGGSEAFWKFHDLAFANQKELTPENFEKWAGEIGLDVAKFKAKLSDKSLGAKVQADLASNRKIGVTGTPAFRINGVTLSGAQPFDRFKAVIDEELKKAEELVKKGTPKKDVSAKLTKQNFKEAPAPDPAKAGDKQPPKDDTTVWKVAIADDDPARGPKDALVTIVMWSDYQCPFCSRVEPTLKQIEEKFGKDVRIVWKDNALPFHKEAKPAANLAIAAYKKGGNDLFWKAHGLLFENQKALGEDTYKTIAGKLGLAPDAVLADIKANKYGPKIDASMDQASDLNARGTPHFFINGRRLSGAQPFAKFEELVNEQLKIAQGLVKAGTPRDKVYEEIMKKAKGPQEPEKREVANPGKDNPFKGKANAKVVIQEFSDFQCPFCSRVNPTIKELMDLYPGQIQVVWRNMPLPFHKEAPLASEAAQEVFVQKGADAFWKYHDILFENQKALTRPDLEKYAEQVGGVDMAKFKKALDDRTHQKVVENDMAVAKKAGVSGTPAFTINGYFLSGAQPLPQFKKLVDLALKEAK